MCSWYVVAYQSFFSITTNMVLFTSNSIQFIHVEKKNAHKKYNLKKKTSLQTRTPSPSIKTYTVYQLITKINNTILHKNLGQYWQRDGCRKRDPEFAKWGGGGLQSQVINFMPKEGGGLQTHYGHFLLKMYNRNGGCTPSPTPTTGVWNTY